MFLIGGPAYSGTTLLALLLNQGDLVCLDEPDFHKLEQSHRSIPVLRTMFPDIHFPDPPTRDLKYSEAVRLMELCELAIAPRRLGIKSCNEVFLNYAHLFRARRLPVICIFRDIRDALVRPLPPWVTEARLNWVYRLVWQHREKFDVWLRYEDLIANPEREMARIGAVLGRQLEARRTWEARDVHPTMLKDDHHELLTAKHLSSSRVGIWRSSGRSWSWRTHLTAAVVGYRRFGWPWVSSR